MRREAAMLVLVERSQWEATFADLAAQADLAARRQQKALPGDRREAVRYGQLCEAIEARAYRLGTTGAAPMVEVAVTADTVGHAWVTEEVQLPSDARALDGVVAHVRAGGVVVELRDPFAAGERQAPLLTGTPLPAAERWRAPNAKNTYEAQRALWESQLERAASGGGEPIVPSGISNAALTEGLRKYARANGRAPTQARVVYRDGSEATHPFPLTALPLVDRIGDGLPELHVALISMRHPEMDTDVDAVWLRNRTVSQVRPQAATDDLVYDISRRQLEQLARKGAVELHVYQTGLQPAVVGFYRAVAAQLAAAPGSIVVYPHFYRRTGGYRLGTPWGAG